MGSTCSCENNNAICNVDTYNSVTGSKNCRVSLANDIFEEKSYRKNLLENVFRKNMANKIQRCYRNYSMIRKSDKNSYEGINYVKSSDNNPKDLNKRNDCKNITFAQGNDHKANNSTVMSMSNLRSSVIYNVAEERLNFEVILITNGAKSEGKESLNNSIKRKEGYMTIITYDSVQINGRYIYDNLTGFAQVMTIDDEFFQGEFVDSIANGFGIYTSTKVVEYVGEWKDNQKNGYGNNTNIYIYIFIFSLILGMETRHSHSIYSGDYLCGKKEGFGFLKLSDGSFYQGNLKDNNFNGYVKYFI